jgi:hypothetical protein
MVVLGKYYPKSLVSMPFSPYISMHLLSTNAFLLPLGDKECVHRISVLRFTYASLTPLG